MPSHTAYSSELNFTLRCLLRQFRQAFARSAEWRDNAFIYRLFGRGEDLSDDVRVCQSTYIQYDRDTYWGRKRRVTQAWRETRSAGEPDKSHIHGNRLLSHASTVCPSAVFDAFKGLTCNTESHCQKKNPPENVGQLSKQLRTMLKLQHRLFIFYVCNRRFCSTCFVMSQRAQMPCCKASQTTGNSPRFWPDSLRQLCFVSF